MEKPRSKKLTALSAIASLIISALLAGAGNLQAEENSAALANFYLSPDLDSFFDAESLCVDVNMDSHGQPVNAVAAEVYFDPAYLQLEATDYSGSFCQLFLPETTDNISGYLNIACGSPAATSTAANIIRLKFKKLQAGFAKLSIDNSAALLNDGSGTSLAVSNETHFIEIIK
jgi:hypothetical protein